MKFYLRAIGYLFINILYLGCTYFLLGALVDLMIPAIFGLAGVGSFIGFALGIGLGIHSGIKSAFEADRIDMINNSGVITYEQYKERQKEVTNDLLISGRSNPKGKLHSYLKNFFK